MPVIKLNTHIKAPATICFNLARSIDLHTISVSGTEEKAVAGVTSGLIGMNEEVTWRARHFGVTQHLTSRITAFQYPFFFRDEMVKGIFKMIRHDHCFEETNGETIMGDTFEFEAPGGLIGRLLCHAVLTRYLTGLLVTRNEIIKQVAENGEWKKLLAG